MVHGQIFCLTETVCMCASKRSKWARIHDGGECTYMQIFLVRSAAFLNLCVCTCVYVHECILLSQSHSMQTQHKIRVLLGIICTHTHTLRAHAWEGGSCPRTARHACSKWIDTFVFYKNTYTNTQIYTYTHIRIRTHTHARTHTHTHECTYTYYIHIHIHIHIHIQISWAYIGRICECQRETSFWQLLTKALESTALANTH